MASGKIPTYNQHESGGQAGLDRGLVVTSSQLDPPTRKFPSLTLSSLQQSKLIAAFITTQKKTKQKHQQNRS